MIQTVDLRLSPADAADPHRVRTAALRQTGLAEERVQLVRPVRRSIDARPRRPVVQLRVELHLDELPAPEPALLDRLRQVADAPEVLIVGAGPAGYFAALELIELGLKPILFDRGKDVRTRRRDLKAIQQDGVVHPHSNYCFGEGGAGTYSDGKLYTRSHKRGNIYKTLKILVEHDANPDILVDAHPHIGSNKLPKIVSNLRATIEAHGGEVHFDSYVTDLLIEKGKIHGVVVNDRDEHRASAVILATGHSARDIYYLLHQKGIRLEAKSFALGVRIEHPQPLIDRLQYNLAQRGEHLPAASYRLACQVKDRGVFSFCMCPGGLVVPAATAPGELVVNGMSMSRRDSPYANSGTVVSVEPEDLKDYQQHGVFAVLEFQKAVERRVFESGTGDQQAPAQRLTDFTRRRVSKDLPGSSYIPGLRPGALHELLPRGIYDRLSAGVQQFGKQMRGYFTEEANVIATESRTSSPVRIPRDAATRMHPEVIGLFPCGEGAGYAGGILSAAMDGQNVARSVAETGLVGTPVSA